MECLQAHTSGPYLWWEGRDNYYGRYVCCVPAWCLVCPGMDQDQDQCRYNLLPTTQSCPGRHTGNITRLQPIQTITGDTIRSYSHIVGIIQTSQAKTRVYNIMKIKHLDLFFMKSNKEKNQIEQCKES